MEETIAFSQLQEVDCLVEKFPLEKVNEAYGECLCEVFRYSPWLTNTFSQTQCSTARSALELSSPWSRRAVWMRAG